MEREWDGAHVKMNDSENVKAFCQRRATGADRREKPEKALPKRKGDWKALHLLLLRWGSRLVILLTKKPKRKIMLCVCVQQNPPPVILIFKQIPCQPLS